MVSSLPVICTSVSGGRLPEARVLAELVARFHGGASTAVLVADASRRELDGEPFEGFVVEDLAMPAGAIHELALCVEGDDLASALVPAFLAVLLEREADRPVVFLDAATVLFGPLLGLGELAERFGVVLSPRVSAPLPLDGLAPDRRWAQRAGGIDPGLVAVGNGARPFLDWWSVALRVAANEERIDLAQSQPFLDAAVGLFEPHLLNDSRFGLAAWNGHEPERLKQRMDPSGSSVLTVRLAGFDRQTPTLLNSEFAQSPRVRLSEDELLGPVCAAHAERLREAIRPGPITPRFSTLPDGVSIEPRMRRLVRSAALAHRIDDSVGTVPDPFDPGHLVDFYAWLASPDAGDRLVPLLPRYVAAIHEERKDLRWHFPRVGTVDGARFREWVENHGLDEEEVPIPVREALSRTDWWVAPTGAVIFPPEYLEPGVVLSGYLRAEAGVGEAARLVRDAFISAGIPISPVTIGVTKSRQLGDQLGPSTADRRTNVIWANADHLPGFASIVGPPFFEGRYTVGGWVWETEHLPKEMAEACVLLDEIWVPSTFAKAAIEPSVDRPVHLFPHPIVAPATGGSFDRGLIGMPPGFAFLFTYDFFSSFTRKNPLGVLAAFKRAFSPGEGPVLVLKSVNGDRHLGELEELRLAARDRPDVVVYDGYLSAAERASLIASCDCYVSLHRSEGFGLGIAEAMALGRPVIATGYSGNLDFMDEKTAMLVPASSIAVGKGNDPYDAQDRWGDPALDVAAELMRRVVEAPTEAAALGARAREHVLSEFGLERAASFVARRMGEIDARCARGYVSGVPAALAAWL